MPHRKISRPPSEFLDIIYQVADIINIKDVQFAIGFGSEDDMDCILGDVYKVIIKGYNNGQIIERAFVVKWIAEPERRASFRSLYLRDHAFHNYVVPTIIDIQKRFKIIEGLKMSFPNCVFSNGEKNRECVVFSSIIEHGYLFHDRFSNIDADHCSLVMKDLAKLHGLCFALQHIDREKSDLIKSFYKDDVQYNGLKPTTNSMVKFYNISVGVVKDPTAKSKLNDCAKDILNILNKCVTPLDRFSTICHADCWNNNVLFKYQRKKPTEVMFVDYQTSRYASPVTDLSYFFYMSADEELLENHYDRLINLYYKTLSAVLRQCNLDVNGIYPEKIFKEHLMEYSVLGLIEALISMKIITAASEEALEMAKQRYEIAEEVTCNGDSQNDCLFVRRVNGVVNDFFKRGYSLDAVLEK